MRRTAILIDDRDRRLGGCVVNDATHLIQHDDGLFIRTDKGVRLSGGGIGVIFEYAEPIIRTKLEKL